MVWRRDGEEATQHRHTPRRHPPPHAAVTHHPTAATPPPHPQPRSTATPPPHRRLPPPHPPPHRRHPPPHRRLPSHENNNTQWIHSSQKASFNLLTTTCLSREAFFGVLLSTACTRATAQTLPSRPLSLGFRSRLGETPPPTKT